MTVCVELSIRERSRTALWRLIHATAKSSSSLNTYPIPDFLGPAAMQRVTFSRARKILGIRILPRAPTLQTYLFWPIGFNQPRELAQYSSDSRFFWSSCNATCDIFTCAKKNWILSGCRKSVCCILETLYRSRRGRGTRPTALSRRRVDQLKALLENISQVKS